MAGLLDTVSKEVAKGRAEVRETFRIPKIGLICGCMVVDGVIPRGANARLLRDNRVIYANAAAESFLSTSAAMLKRMRFDEVVAFGCPISSRRL